MFNTITLALSGASGMPYAFRLLEQLVKAQKQIYFVQSQAAQMVIALETEFKWPTQPQKLETVLTERYAAAPGQIKVFSNNNWLAPIASGSGISDAMVICPCTSGCLAAIAHGMSDNLLERAADVILKEQRKLIMVIRETPFSAIHLENMLKLARLGAVILPANPGFYNKPQTIDDLVDFIVARILDQLQISNELNVRWGLS
ncbi:MAG: aromatic acid decarboxylase [Gammaproteobacteria bacterium]|jgi:4-hydroxy-3-polyprenylbenzoate decarboxylase|nr:aromatic acid decarboxylase [Gammaproteobacteria bacterium]